MFCLYTLCSVQAKIQILTTSCRILARFHQGLFKSLWLYPRVKNSITNLTINLDTLSLRTLSICAISSLGTLMIPYSNFRCPGQLASQFSTELHIQYTCGWIMVYLTFSIIYLFTYLRRNIGTNRTFYSNWFAILRSKFIKKISR